MAGNLFSGMEAFGLKNTNSLNVFEESKKAEEKANVVEKKISEKDYLFDKSCTCPVCGEQYKIRAVMGNRAKLLGVDRDLRPRHENVDVTKYDVIGCRRCGYTALSRYFPNIYDSQKKLVREKISVNITSAPVPYKEVITYEDALTLIKLALYNAVVKGAKDSEKAYICLKGMWIARGLSEEKAGDEAALSEAKEIEAEFRKNAYEGFYKAVQSEDFPMCGMDEATVDYLMAVLSFDLGKDDVASKLVGKILQSPSASARLKERTRDLKDEIVKKIKQNK